ncbi:MAG: M48 family metalloprotease [Clostridia bacterium]|nr:M48 family metalloprotease [Clostridia bacterium]
MVVENDIMTKNTSKEKNMYNNQNDKETKKQGILTPVIAFLVALASPILGVVCLTNESLNRSGILVAELLLFTLVIFLMPLNKFLEKKQLSKLKNMNAAEVQSFFLSQRENSEKTTKEQLSLLKKLRTITNVYVIFLLAIAFIIAFFSYQTNISWISAPLTLFSTYIFYTVFSWLKNPYTKKVFKENETYVEKADYPYLYKMAEKARDVMGCKGKIKIAIISDNNAGIAQIDGMYSIQLGTIFLNTASEEEVFCVLLHEFAHIIWENKYCVKETKYFNRLSFNAESFSRETILTSLFSFPTTIYLLNYELFRYSAALTVEEYADKAMSKYGNEKSAASALIKLRYYEYYSWEDGTKDEEPSFASESPMQNFVTIVCNRFKTAIKENSEKWNELIDKEILSRSASHPTTKMRLDSLGVKKTETISSPSSKEFLSDAEKSLKFADAIFLKYNKELFEEQHKQYVSAKEKIKEWEEDGKPIIAEEYRFIVQSLRTIGRNSEAVEVCDRAINTLSSSGAAYAYYIKGNYLIHKYDVSGIECIYKAMNNHNYIDEGLEMIGQFCCMTGRQKELDEYREKAVLLAQEQMDKFNKLSGLNKDDDLSEEKLPSGMLDSILKYIMSIENGKIEKIYLIRKTVSEDFYGSVFVVKLFPFSNEKERDEAFEIMDKIFNHLDTCSEHQFCLYDYESVSHIKFDEIPNSCVYTSKK